MAANNGFDWRQHVRLEGFSDTQRVMLELALDSIANAHDGEGVQLLTAASQNGPLLIRSANDGSGVVDGRVDIDFNEIERVYVRHGSQLTPISLTDALVHEIRHITQPKETPFPRLEQPLREMFANLGYNESDNATAIEEFRRVLGPEQRMGFIRALASLPPDNRFAHFMMGSQLNSYGMPHLASAILQHGPTPFIQAFAQAGITDANGILLYELDAVAFTDRFMGRNFCTTLRREDYRNATEGDRHAVIVLPLAPTPCRVEDAALGQLVSPPSPRSGEQPQNTRQ